MTAVVAVAIVIIFSTGVITGVIVVVSMASRREDKRGRLSREAPDRPTLAGRYLTSLYVRRAGDEVIPQILRDGDQSELSSLPQLGPEERD